MNLWQVIRVCKVYWSPIYWSKDGGMSFVWTPPSKANWASDPVNFQFSPNTLGCHTHKVLNTQAHTYIRCPAQILLDTTRLTVKDTSYSISVFRNTMKLHTTLHRACHMLCIQLAWNCLLEQIEQSKLVRYWSGCSPFTKHIIWSHSRFKRQSNQYF